MPFDLTRRQVMIAAGGLLLPQAVRAEPAPIYIADMHYHLFFVGRRPAHKQELAANMASGRATLVSWSLVGDMPWLRATAGGFKQKGMPSGGEATSWLKEEVGRVRAYMEDQKLAIARTPADVERAARGQPHIILSVEGATFADDGLAQLKLAHDLGVRHIQLVHFIGNKIGDIQTEAAMHGGLSGYGREVIAECNRLGILIDLAHCTERVVEQVLAVSKVPVVWSHSSLQRSLGLSGLFAPRSAWRMRQLPVATARAIAKSGGVVGLWALGADVGLGAEGYARRVLEMADLLGDDHVAFGTDMNALAAPAIRTFSDLRRALDVMQRAGKDESQLRKIAMDNYANALKVAMRSRTA